MRRTARGLLCTLCLLTQAGCEEQKVNSAPLIQDEKCVEAPFPERSLLSAGLLEGARYFDCDWPGSGGSEAWFSKLQTQSVIVTGIPLELRLTYDGADTLDGRTMLVGVGDKGYYTVEGQDMNPLFGSLFLDPDAPSRLAKFRFAILSEDSTGEQPVIGTTTSASVQFIHVGTGDIQINLHWTKHSDVDMHVFDPTGEEIFYGHPLAMSGGELDLDSYAGCQIEGDRGRGNENVFWPDGKAPKGEYTVMINLYSDCDVLLEDNIDFQVTLVQDRTKVSRFRNTFTSGGPTDIVAFTFTR